MTDKWNKHTYVCPTCDGLFEMTIGSYRTIDNKLCPACFNTLTLLSVEDVTIQPTNEREKMLNNLENDVPFGATITDAYNPNLLVTYKKIEGEGTTYATEKVSDIEWSLHQARRNYQALTDKQNQWYKKESQLRTLLEEVYADSEEQETLGQIAEIFDVPLTKEIEYTAWVRVDMTVEVELGGDVDAVEDFISSNLTIDSYDSMIQVTNYEVERTEEGAY